MDPSSITQYITETFDGVDVVVASGDTFFFSDPGRNLPPDRRSPFTTVVTNDNYDHASNLNRPSVFRLNVGVGKGTYRALFGSRASSSSAGGVGDDGSEFSPP